MSNTEMSAGLPPEGQFDEYAASVGQPEMTLDYLGYEEGFTSPELAFATQQAVDAHQDVLRTEFAVATAAEDAPAGPLATEPEDPAVGPVEQARDALGRVSHEAIVQAMPGRLDEARWFNDAADRIFTGLEAEMGATGAAQVSESEEKPATAGLGNVWESQLVDSWVADKQAFERANSEPTALSLQDAAVSLAGIRHALNAARGENPYETAGEELRLRNAARWVVERTVAPPADVTTMARVYNFAIDEAVNHRPDQPVPTELQPAA